MSVEPRRRDYGLTGESARRAVAAGLADARWYTAPLPRKQLKELMQRGDGPALRDTALWLTLLGVSGFLGWQYWGGWAALPCFVVYGILYGSASDSRWHECGHGTAFKTPWMNSVVYHIACFMILREPTIWRWSHARHHTDTIIVGRDPEIAVPRPPRLFDLILNLFALKSGAIALRNLLLHARGRLTADERSFIPESEFPAIHRVARIYVAIFAAVIVACVAAGSILPAMLVGLPSFYGGFFVLFFGLTQHAGLAEDVLDHRLNSRTVYMNPVFRFLYWNMNYHVEHHIFPLVPYHALPRLHAAIEPHCPPPYANCLEAYREILPALARQRRDPSHSVARPLPDAAPTAAQ